MLCVYQFKVVLRGISPMIWRRLLLRSDHSIADLHYTIQIAMGWSDSHLHRFHIHGKDYGVAHEGGLTFSDDPERVLLGQFGFRLREHGNPGKSTGAFRVARNSFSLSIPFLIDKTLHDFC
jgi:hypothetical protein